MQMDGLTQVGRQSVDGSIGDTRQVILRSQLVRGRAGGYAISPPFRRTVFRGLVSAAPIDVTMVSNAVNPGSHRSSPGKGWQRLPHASEGPLRQVSRIGIVITEPPQESVNPFVKQIDQIHRR